MISIPDKLVIYDGDCGFCNRSVQFIIDNNPKRDIMFSSYQSEFGNKCITKYKISESPEDTLIYIINEKVLYRSSAVFEISKSMHWRYRPLSLLKIIPRKIRDWGYNQISKRRRSIIKNDFCSLEHKQKYQPRVLA